MPRKPIDTMTEQEMREHLTDQAKAAKKRGADYRKQQQKAGKVRFSCFVPKALKAEVEESVKQILKRHASAVAVSMHPVETDKEPS